MDSEPATISLSRLASEIRQQLGYNTLVRHAKDYEKGRTAKVERFIQTVRRHASTLVGSSNGKNAYPSEHAAWAVKQSVFLLNRFHFHHSLRSTPFFALNGYNYMCWRSSIWVEEAGKERRGTLGQKCLVGQEQPGCQHFGHKRWNLLNGLSEAKQRTMGERIDLCFGHALEGFASWRETNADKAECPRYD